VSVLVLIRGNVGEVTTGTRIVADAGRVREACLANGWRFVDPPR
jgi:hypothetical protein